MALIDKIAEKKGIEIINMLQDVKNSVAYNNELLALIKEYANVQKDREEYTNLKTREDINKLETALSKFANELKNEKDYNSWRFLSEKDWIEFLENEWINFKNEYKNLYLLKEKLEFPLDEEYVRKLVLLYRAFSDLVESEYNFEDLNKYTLDRHIHRFFDTAVNLIKFEEMVNVLDIYEFKLSESFKSQFKKIKDKYNSADNFVSDLFDIEV